MASPINLGFIVQAFFIVTSTIAFGQGAGEPGTWSFLGSRTVNYRLDRDEIKVTHSEGVFSALQIRVRRAGIDMLKAVVHFGDGSTQEIEMRETLRQGSVSRVIDLEGNNRVIKKVVFWYDTKNYRRHRAIVELWGKRTR